MRTTTRRVVSSVLAVMLLSTAGLSQVMRPPKVARSVATAPLDSAEQDFRAAAARHEPIELSVREDVRERCRGYALPPEPYVLAPAAESEADAEALSGVVACFVDGPLSRRGLDLIGPTELPGRLEYPEEAAAPADQTRVLLDRLGVPLQRMTTHDVAIDPLVSPHAAPRVVLAIAED